MDVEDILYTSFRTRFGDIAVVWRTESAGPRVRHIVLCGGRPARLAALEKFPGARADTAAEIDDLCGRMMEFLNGRDIAFDLDMTAMEVCGAFQRRILKAEHAVPRGWVSTYGRLARKAGSEGGGRAAGRALAENPFPIVIPCHRTVRANGDLGGYRGGREMKRALLEMEGVGFDRKGKVLLNRVYYPA